jgi:hypothetical protein
VPIVDGGKFFSDLQNTQSKGDRAPKGIFVSHSYELTGRREELHSEEVHNSC